MKWIHTQEQTIPTIESSVLTIGNFDGVHLGHQQLLKSLIKSAQENSTLSVVCTFKPHPRVILRPEEPHHRLFDYRDQAEVMESLGIDYLVEEKFSKDFSLMSADEFLQNYVLKNYKPLHVVVGHDFNFGKARVGNFSVLEEFCKKHNIGLTVVDPYKIEGNIVSTSQIRKCLEIADLDHAKKYLGRSYYLRGPVRLGHKRGITIGVPTANISPEIEFAPRKGVYFTKSTVDGAVYPSITNIGYNPTFETKDSYLKVETHILNFNQDIYGKQMSVELVKFLRDEKRFSGIDELKQQIYKDISEAKNFFGVK